MPQTVKVSVSFGFSLSSFLTKELVLTSINRVTASLKTFLWYSIHAPYYSCRIKFDPQCDVGLFLSLQLCSWTCERLNTESLCQLPWMSAQ